VTGISLARFIDMNLHGAGTGTDRFAPLLRRSAIRVGVAAVWLLAPAAVPRAQACVCDASPACSAAWQADAVFVGIAVNEVAEPLGGSLSWIVQHVVVTEKLRGFVDPSITMVTGDEPTPERIAQASSLGAVSWGGSDCDYRFQVGGEYLIYARRTPGGRWTTSRCSGTKPINEATKDLEYFASLASAEPVGRLYGKVESEVINPFDPTKSLRVPAAGVAVALTGESNRLMATTDAKGNLDVRVPPGEYSIAPVVPETVRAYGAPLHRSVAAKGCGTVYFVLIADGRIEGRVVHENGTPVPHTSVDVIPADLPLDQRPDGATAPSAFTDEEGRFRVQAILPGRYVIAVNGRFGPRLESPYAVTYFPGVSRQDAPVIGIGEGERKTGFTIVVKRLTETTISGVVVFTNGQPIANGFVTAGPVGPAVMFTALSKIDSSGAFHLRVLSGLTYVIKANTETATGSRYAETTVFVEQRTEGVRLSIRP